MTRKSFLIPAVLLLLNANLHPTLLAQTSPQTVQTEALSSGALPDLQLVEITSGGAARIKPDNFNEATVALSQDPAAPGLNVTLPASKRTPGVQLAPPEGAAAWDLSKYGHIQARVVNTGTDTMNIFLRVDNKSGDSNEPWDTEKVRLKPGESGTVKVIFGYAYGFNKAYKLNPAEVVRLLFFLDKSAAERTFRIESVTAGGPPGEQPPFDPESARIIPEKGVILGSGVKIDAAKQLTAAGGAAASVDGAGNIVNVTFIKAGQSVTLKPSMGCWNLTDSLQVSVKLKNTGKQPALPALRIDSKRGTTDTANAAVPIVPGAEGVITASFIPAVPGVIPTDPRQEVVGPGTWSERNWGTKEGTGTKFASNVVKGIVLLAGSETGLQQSLQVESITAGVPPEPDLPDWLGKRPPVEGDWVKTLDEEFDGTSLNPAAWSTYGPNYYDKSHFTKENVLLGGGVVKLRFEKKIGFQNDDPGDTQIGKTAYASGYLESYGKWVQRYGYFEARMKLPKAPGLWPAFWLVPDRGPSLPDRYKRGSTGNGGMELDIMEFLSRWGIYRYNIAMHWDGYEKNHRSCGAEGIYFQPDKEGYVTAGLLWKPGLTVYYANGKEVLRWESPRISNVPSFIIFTAVSGGWDNDPVDDATLPADFVIDYVRVWQLKELASPVDSPAIGVSAASQTR